MSQESDICCTTSMYDVQNRCILDEIDLFYLKVCIITHNNNIIEQNIDVSTFNILSVKKPHTNSCCGLAVIFCGFISLLIGRETINIPEIFSGVHGFTGKTVRSCVHFKSSELILF